MFDFDMISLNVRGIRDFKKCTKMFHWINKHAGNKGISFLQETHSTKEIENEWKQRFCGEIFFSHGTAKSKGVAILLGNKLDFTIIDQSSDDDGRLIILKCLIQGNECLLINSYFPNTEKEQIAFLKTLYGKLESIVDSSNIPIIWGG